MIRRSGWAPMGPPGALLDPRTRTSRRTPTMTRIPSLTERERFHIAIMARSGPFRGTALAEAFGVDLTTVLACEREHGRAPRLRPDVSVGGGGEPGDQSAARPPGPARIPGHR